MCLSESLYSLGVHAELCVGARRLSCPFTSFLLWVKLQAHQPDTCVFEDDIFFTQVMRSIDNADVNQPFFEIYAPHSVHVPLQVRRRSYVFELLWLCTRVVTSTTTVVVMNSCVFLYSII